MVSVRSSRDPRLKKQAMLRQSNQNEARQFDPTNLKKTCHISKVVNKMSFVEYQARQAVGKGISSKEREKYDDEAEQANLEDQVAAGQATPGGKEKMCPEAVKNCENCLEKNMEEASNPKNATKPTAAEENFEVPVNSPERASCEENDCESKMQRLLEELTQLSKELEEEKEKSRRLHQENASLDIELELIEEKLK